MTYRTHNIFGFALLLATLVNFPQKSLGVMTIIGGLIANAIGSIMPDIDQASNKLWSLVPGGSWTGNFIRRIFISHRSVSHSLIGTYIAFEIFVRLIPKLLNDNFINVEMIIFSMMIGYASHIIIDFMTEEGVPLLWPITWKLGFPPFKSWRIKTGKWFEKWVVFPLIIAWIGWIILNNWRGLMLIW